MLEIFFVYSKNVQITNKINYFFLFFRNFIKRISLSCSITAEIENYEEAKKRYIKKKINYLL